ncbi:restriction endonuclease subunit M/S [Sporolactobacillus sp. THM7-7]|nr:restriction endonuclease subunit M/S [Sporolactobacillus sp. THM7-7]
MEVIAMNLEQVLSNGVEALKDDLPAEKSLPLVTLFLGICAIAVQRHQFSIEDPVLPDNGQNLFQSVPDVEKWIAAYKELRQPGTIKILLPFIKKIELRRLHAADLSHAFTKQAAQLKILSITPAEINRLIASLLDLQNASSVYDGTCGFGGTQVALAERNSNATYYGQDINPEVAALADMFLTLQNVSHQTVAGDSIMKPSFFKGSALRLFDCVVLDPPFGIKTMQDPKVASYGRFDTLNQKMRQMDFYFILNAVERSKGKTLVVTSHAPLVRTIAAERKVRRYLLPRLTAVIRLPAGLYRKTAIQTHLLLFDRVKKNNQVLMIDASGFAEGRLREKQLSEDGTESILSVMKQPKDMDGFSKTVTHDEIMENEDSWDVEKYIVHSVFQTRRRGTIRWDVDKLQTTKKVPVKNLCQVIKGFNLTSKHKQTAHGMRILRLNDIDQDGRINIGSVTRFDVTADLGRHKLKKGDVILVAKGTQQKITVFNSKKDVYLSINLMALRPKDVHPYFLKAYLESPIGEYFLAKNTTGSSLPVLTAKNIGLLPIPEDLVHQAGEIGEAFRKARKKYLKKLDEVKKQYKKKLDKLDNQMNPGLWREI